MNYGFSRSRSTFRSPRGRVSYPGLGQRASSDSYHTSSSRESFSTKPTFRGSSFQSSSYHGLHDDHDSRNRGTQYNGDPYPTSHRRRDEEPRFHRRETREPSSGSYSREHTNSHHDGELDRNQMRTSAIESFQEGCSPRRPFDENVHPKRSLNTSSSPHRTHSSPSGGESYTKDFIAFKKPLPPSDYPTYSSRRPARGFRGRVATLRPASTSSLPRQNSNRFNPLPQLQLTWRKEKQLEIVRLQKERETRDRSSTPEKSYPEDNQKSSSSKEEPQADRDVDMEAPNSDDGPPGVSSSPDRKSPNNEKSGASPEKSGSEYESPKFKARTRTCRGIRRIPLKCPHCKMECQQFKSYQAHLSTLRHETAMAKLLCDLKQKLRRLRTEQRQEQRLINERDDNSYRALYCRLCKLVYKQTRQEHLTSDFHVSMVEFLDSRCKICRLDFATPLLYQQHRCTLTHIKRKAALKRNGALIDETQEENNDEESFMVLDSVGSADESNEDVDPSKENDDLAERTSLEVKKKTKIIGSEYIEKVDTYYCQLCKLCLIYTPQRDVEDDLLSHCRSRFHLKRFSMQDAKNKSEKTVLNGTRKKSVDMASVEAVNGNDENAQFSADDGVTGDDHKLSDDDSRNRDDRLKASTEHGNAEKVKVEPSDDDQPTKNADIQQNVIVKEPE